MTRKEATEIAYEMGGHPYSLISMVDAMMKGVEIGKKEQKAIDDDHLREAKKMVIDKACEWLEENQAHIISESGVWLYWTAFLKDFRKAIEDKI